MAANNYALYPQTQNINYAQISAADASYTAPTASQTVITAGANGTKITCIKVRAIGSNAAGVMRFFIKDSVGYHLFYELSLPITIASTTSPAQSADIVLLPINYDNMGASTGGLGVLPDSLKTGQSIVVTLGAAATTGYSVIGDGADY
jgi:hypothetical protein